jgi:hypothetical protein
MAASGELYVEVDAEHGGRWVSLRAPSGREWLWRRDAPARVQVRPGDPFVDAGGLEECLPTIGGIPDHGDAWSRRWVADNDCLVVHGDGYELHRRIVVEGAGLVASYRLAAEPGWRFIWAGHALLELSTSARLVAPAGHPTVVGSAAGSTRTSWPWLSGTDLSRLGESDGSALMIFLVDLSEITVRDEAEQLTVSLVAGDAPHAIAVWRNLGGWPEAAPYRSIGVEPVLGRTGDLSVAGPGDAVTVPPSGVVEWSLRLTTSAVARPSQPLP